MRCLVTGGSGFIGSALCRSLIQDGHAVSVLTRNREAASGRLPATIRLIESLDDAGIFDVVFNLQGENLAAGRWTEARKREFERSRIDFTHRLIQWMERNTPGVLVNGSAIGWYGNRGDEVLDESATPGDDFAARLCQRWEDSASQAQALGVRVCLVRTGVVLDRDGGALAKMLPPFRLGLGGPIGPGTQWMSWIARHDLVRLLRWLAESPQARGAYNGTAPGSVNNRDFGRTLGRALRRPAALPMPAFAVRILFGEMADLLLGSQRVMPQRARDQGFQFDSPELGDALTRILAA